jgi:hypothetical protein
MKISIAMIYVSSVVRLLIVTFILLSVQPLAGQETKVVRDLHLWTGAALEKKVGKDWTFSLAEEIRFKQDISEINNYFTDAGVRYRISKNFALEAGYRYTRDRKSDGTYETLTRYNLDLRYKGQLDYISIHYRLRYQKEVEGFNLLDQGVDYEKYVRNRIRIRYDDFKKFKPYVSAEIFQQFSPNQTPEFEYVRIQGGVKYEPGKIGVFGFALGFNRELNEVEPATIYMLRANYTYKF